MTNTAPPVVCAGDAYFQDPTGFFARLRESGPVTEAWMPHYGRVWLITRYAEVRAALADPRLAKDLGRWPGGGRTRPSLAAGIDAHMLHRDPPHHTRLRRLAQKAFTPRRAAMRPRAEEIAATLLDDLDGKAGGGPVDLLEEYARPLPIAVICQLLGVPVAEREWIRTTVYAYDDHAQHARVERDLAA